MREISAEARLHLYARSLSGTDRAARASIPRHSTAPSRVIAAVVFGTLSVHPFYADHCRRLERRHVDARILQRLPHAAGDIDRAGVSP